MPAYRPCAKLVLLRMNRSRSARYGTGFRSSFITLHSALPSCLQGLARYNQDADIEADYIVVEMARHLLGADWMESYVAKANNGGIERVLLWCV